MSWERILQMDPGAVGPLRLRIDALFAQQRATWPALREGEAALDRLQRKPLFSGGDSIFVQLNPARRRSTMAKTDAKAVAARACFLCPQSMPEEERGVAFEDLVVLPNPYPVLPMHCTIAAREHCPQRIAGRLGSLLRLAEAIGPDLVALYNGPRCGASAPDHFHFQAAAAQEIPILSQLTAAASGRSVAAHSSFGRNVLVFGSGSVEEVEAGLSRAIDVLRGMDTAADEPMFNLLAHYQTRRWTVLLFPRSKHRPACFFAAGSEKLLVSPAVLEMCGVLVTTEPADFDPIDADTARAIYEEVSLCGEQFARLATMAA